MEPDVAGAPEPAYETGATDPALAPYAARPHPVESAPRGAPRRGRSSNIWLFTAAAAGADNPSHRIQNAGSGREAGQSVEEFRRAKPPSEYETIRKPSRGARPLNRTLRRMPFSSMPRVDDKLLGRQPAGYRRGLLKGPRPDNLRSPMK